MKKAMSYALLLVTIPTFSSADVTLVNKMVKPFVYILNDKNSIIGGGTVIKKTKQNIYILTAYHLVDSLDVVRVEIPKWNSKGKYRSSMLIQANCVEWDEDIDFAILKIENKNNIYVCVVAECGKKDIKMVGLFDKVFAVGATVGEKVWASEGIISCLQTTHPFIGVSAPVFFGSSGGPVYNNDGKMIGFTSFMRGTEYYPIAHLHFICPLSSIIR